MSARILVLPTERPRQRTPQAATRGSITCSPGAAPAQGATAAAAAEHCHFWRGASGRAYVHTVYGLLECPPLPAANYLLARRDTAGRRHVLSIGRVRHAAPTLNLAEIRHRAASLGANEVHVHLLAPGEAQSLAVELDLSAAGHAGRPPAGAARQRIATA